MKHQLFASIFVLSFVLGLAGCFASFIPAKATPNYILGSQFTNTGFVGIGTETAIFGPFTAGKTGNITELNFWVNSTDSTSSAIAVIYADSAGAPGALLASGTPVSVTVGPLAWYTSGGFNINVIAGNVYWLGITANVTSGFLVVGAASSGSTTYRGAGTYPYLPNPATPSLVVTGSSQVGMYASISSYRIVGPFYESGTVGPNTTITVYYTSGLIEHHSLNGSLGVAQTITISPTLTPLYITWNVSSTYLRTYYFDPYLSAEETAIVFVPDVNVAILPYSFYVTDFYGMNTPYLSTSIIYNGTEHVVERIVLNVNPATFMMQQWYYYTLTYTCTQGTYSHGFHAESSFSQNENILNGMFPAANYTTPLSAHATRYNSTRITATYQNTNATTDWLYFNITHRSGLSTILDYSSNVTSNSYTLNWDNAVADTSYIVSIQTSIGGVITEWRYPAATIPVSANPFSGMFSALGTWPVGFDADQLPAAIIILCVLAVFSYSSAGVGAVLSFIVGGVLIVLGWFTPNLQVFGFSGFIAIVLGFLDAKRTEREL
jgi:hypothetical protein